MAMTRRPVSASISRTVKTVSYKIEFPTFFVESVLVATYSTPDRALIQNGTSALDILT